MYEQSPRPMRPSSFEPFSPEAALAWMQSRNMVARSPTKDPETMATVPGYVLSDSFRETLAAALLSLLAKANRARGKHWKGLTVRDAFITASIAAVLQVGGVQLSDDEMMSCVNVALTMLPFDRLEKAGLASKSIRSLSRNRKLATEMHRLIV